MDIATKRILFIQQETPLGSYKLEGQGMAFVSYLSYTICTKDAARVYVFIVQSFPVDSLANIKIYLQQITD